MSHSLNSVPSDGSGGGCRTAGVSSQRACQRCRIDTSAARSCMPVLGTSRALGSPGLRSQRLGAGAVASDAVGAAG